MAFSGGLDSGAVLLCLYRALLDSGQSPARLKAFTLAVGREGKDAGQAREFLRLMDLEAFGEPIEVDPDAVSALEAVAVIEDYKPLDVQCAAVALALARGIRERHPDWRLLVDGDGGDENLKDYPIEENAELTIRSVVNNRMLYQEGWGCESLKHSLVFSGGYSRACVRTYASLRRHGFVGFSPFTCPHGRGRGRGHSLRRVGGGPDGAPLRPQGRDREPGREVGARPRHAGVPEATLPARRRGARGRGSPLRGQRRDL